MFNIFKYINFGAEVKHHKKRVRAHLYLKLNFPNI